MFATRNGHEDVADGADQGRRRSEADQRRRPHRDDGRDRQRPVRSRRRSCVDLGATANDGSLYFAVDMHDATTDMRAHDGSRLRADHPNKLTSMDLIKFLLDKGADPNKPFQGQIHNTTLCCDPEVNSSPFYRAAIAADVDALKLMLANGAKVDWSPGGVQEAGRAGGAPAGGGRGRGVNANVGKTASMMAMTGGRGAPFCRGPRIRSHRRAAVPRGGHPRSGRGAEAPARRPAPIRTPRRRTARRCCIRRSLSGAPTRFARSSPRARSSTPSTRTT